MREAVISGAIDPSAVRLEITESVTFQDADRTITILGQLRAFGIRVSIDDFGTGYSSLSYLHRLPFDTLKIDRSFINALSQNNECRDMVRTILDLARNLKVEVIAEGPKPRRIEELQEMGCLFAQGYHFSMPVTQPLPRRCLAPVRIDDIKPNCAACNSPYRSTT